MITLWLAAGLLTGASEVVTVTPRALGDDGGVRRRFWKAKAEEWLREQLEAIEAAVGRPQRARKRLATRIVGTVPAFVAESDDLAPRLAAVERLAAMVAKPAPDYSAIAEAVAAQMAAIAGWQAKERRRRDMEALMVLAA